MQLDPNNKIIKLCARGMILEGEGKNEEAAHLFNQAWSESVTSHERMISAHYVARQQSSVSDKLHWDKLALDLALMMGSQEDVKSFYPSLYLNIGKCYEDLNDPGKALENYRQALSFAENMPDDGYNRMIKAGIVEGIDRVKSFT